MRDRKLRAKYGIGIDEYDRLLAAQGGRCAICKSPDPRNRWGVFVVDHCHATKRNRGLLCGPCNLMLGYAQDDPETLSAAIEYLS